MTSLEGFEPVAISPHKQDPAWKYCQLFIKKQPNGGRAELKKCLYCGKVFQGGGINRLKSHLAGRKGNGPTCDQVPPDVRLLMLQSLDDGIATIRQRRRQIVINPHQGPSGIGNSFDENGECRLVLGPISDSLGSQEEDAGMSGDGISLSDNLTNVPLEVDNSYRNNALQRVIGVPNLSFSLNEEEDVGTSVDRRVRLRGETSFAAIVDGAGSGSGSVVGVTKLRNRPAPIRSYEDTQGRSIDFPNSNLSENEDVGIRNTLMSARKRVRDEDAAVLANGGTTGHTEVEKVNSQHIHMAIGRFLYEIQAPLDAVKNSVYFQPMFDAIASGGMDTIAPSYHDLRGWILKNTVEEVKSDIQRHTEIWVRTGCSLLVNEWNSEKGRTFLNFAVYCPDGIIYLKSVDASYFIYSPDALYEFFKQVVEEVGVQNVLQVITNTGEQYAVAGKRLMDTFPTLYWSPCAAACIDSIFEDFGKLEWINSVIEQARSVTRFMYKHVVTLNMMRRYTFGNDIVRLGVSRFTTNFMTLKQMVDLKFNLQSMVTSKEWASCPNAKTPEGLAVLDILSDHSFWTSCILITRLTDPLLQVLRIAGSQKRPAIGYVFAGIYRAKETIKRELVKREEYMVYWNIIDQRWKRLWHLPLHTAGFYFNPKFFYSIRGDMHNDIVSRMFDCIERLVPDIKVQDEIIKEINLYKNAVGDLGRNLAVRARDNLLPAEWWSTYGGGCPNLARLAIRILSQTCSLIQCTENQIPFEQLHKTRNSLERQRLSDLVSVQYNLRLRQMVHKNKEQAYVDPISFASPSIVEDWVTETGTHLEDNETPDWMSIDPPSDNSRLLKLAADEAEDLGSGFDDDQIFNVLKVVKGEC